MKNWEDYVTIQPLNEEDDEGSVFYLSSHTDGVLRIDRVKINKLELTLSHEEVGEKVEKILLEFPEVQAKNEVELILAIHEVCKKSRRGMPNCNYKKTWFYKGEAIYDSPIIVCSANGKYAVTKHPNFESYGFNAIP